MHRPQPMRRRKMRMSKFGESNRFLRATLRPECKRPKRDKALTHNALIAAAFRLKS